VAPTVAAISVTPVKGFELIHPDDVELTVHGVVANRRFVLVDGEGERLKSSLTAWPILVRGHYDQVTERLWMAFPDGTEIEESAHGNGAPVRFGYNGDRFDGHVVEGAWEPHLSALAGHAVRVVRTDRLGEVPAEPVTLVSRASVDRLAQEAGEPVDPRRFRMLFDLDRCRPHEEDTWDGRRFAVGDAILRVGGPVARCAMTTRDPVTGERNLDTLRLIKDYRGQLDGGEIPFGVYARVEQPGRVAVGDEFREL